MATTLDPTDTIETLADLVERLGDIDLRRIRYRPPLGMATEHDVIDVERRERRLCELIDGVLVEKPMGMAESLVAAVVIELLRRWVTPRNLGVVSAPDGPVRLLPGLVRYPDVAFIAWEQARAWVPGEAIQALVPDLAIEILSRSNTRLEMFRKREEYFSAGVRLVWEIDPEARTVAVYTAPDVVTVLDATQTLDGGEVLPGFSVQVAELFAELDRLAKK